MTDFAINYIKEKNQIIEKNLCNHWGEYPEQVAVLFDAMNYSLQAGGKRLRPVLHLATLEMLDVEPTNFLNFACALEMIHTYSLIHDDLPAMDDDDLRRGKPTNHKVYGEANAILAGDALLTHAFHLMLDNEADAEKLVEATKLVSLAAGINGMVAGQIADIAAESKKIDLNELRYIHANKTGALFMASIVSAGILAGVDNEKREALENFSLNFGIAFQIADDILDVIGDETKIGKPVGSDEKNEKSTYVSLLGLEKSQELLAEASNEAINALKIFGTKANALIEIINYCAKREF